MAYFVTGATGFIGRHLVEQLLKRDGDIHVLVREGSLDRLEKLSQEWGEPTRIKAVVGDLRAAQARRLRRRHRGAEGEDRPLLPPRRDLRHDRGRRRQRGAQRRRHQARGRARQRAGGRLPPPHLLGRGRRTAQGPLPRGHVRRGPEAPVRLPPHEVRVREDRARAGEGALARLPPRRRRRQLQDRRDGQDRRALLLLPGHPAHARPATAVAAADRAGARLHERRAGRLRREGDGPHRPPARPGRPGVPPDEPQVAALGRGPERVREGRARAAALGAHRQAHHRRAAQGRLLDADEAPGAQGRPQDGPRRLRHPRRGDRARRLHRPVRHPRYRARAEGIRHRGPRPLDVRLQAVGLLGAQPRPRRSSRTARCARPSTAARS